MNPKEATALVAVLVEGFPNAKIGQGTVAVYAKALQDLDYAGAQAAVARMLNGGDWFPTIHQIRDSYFDAAFGFPSQDAAMIELKRNIREAGQYIGKTKWSHPILAACAESVGWWRLSNGENPAADYAQFLKAYESMRKATISEASLESAGIPSGTPKLPWRAAMPALPGRTPTPPTEARA